MPHIDEKDPKPQYLHVKHQNTRKNTIKIGENTLFSQIDKILKMHSRFVEQIPFYFFSVSRTDFNPLYRQILVRVKGDQIYYNM